MKQVFFFIVITVSFIFSSCVSKEKKYFEKELVFPENMKSEHKVKLAAYLIPTAKQLAWQELELTAFVHFGMNTFTGKEWGDGTEDPTLFSPTDFNAEQWVRTLQEAGFKMLIFTAKHHDGFCLWQTKTTTHSVTSSPWRDGQGDVVREVKNACDKYGLKFGIYLSPWDRKAESYGDSINYNNLFTQQLTELLTNYGEIHEVWFDGAHEEDIETKTQEYDWQRFYQVIDSLQPNAVKAIMGNDIRWVGNENDFGRSTEWSVTPLNPEINESILQQNRRLNISPVSEDLGSRKLIVEAKQLYWYPSEVDVSIRPGWFYHPEEDHEVKSLQQLVDIYYQSVGMNSVLLLNVPPDKRGLLHDIDVNRIKEFGAYVKNTFDKNNITTEPKIWTAKPGSEKEYNLNGDTINTIMLKEDIGKGQRAEVFRIDGFIDNEWIKLAEGTTIGYKRLLKFDDCAPSKIRLSIIEARDKVNIAHIGAYRAPAIAATADTLLSDIQKDKWRVVTKSPLIVDLGETVAVKGFSYSPKPNRESVFKYAFSVSEDGKNWKEISNSQFTDIKNNPSTQFVRFKESSTASFVKFETISGAEGGKPGIGVDQLGILVK